MLTGLNHITLAVTDLSVSFEFYVHILGFVPDVRWQGGAYLHLGDLWLCLSVDEQASEAVRADYTHYAFSIRAEDMAEFAKRLERHGVPLWKQNSSEGDSLYFLDPDGHRLEAHVGDLHSRLASLQGGGYEGVRWF